MGIGNIFKKTKGSIDCASIKNADDLYPQNSLTIVMTQTESGNVGTGWIDLAYEDYKYKSCFPHNLQFEVDILEKDVDSDNLDYGTLEDYFVNALKKGCITHPVSRVATDKGFIMDIYVDDADFAMNLLTEMYEDPNKIVDFGCGFNHDPKWKEYSRIIKMTQ